jgi:hypothetical protein
MDAALSRANRLIESWTLEELKTFAFDRLVTEYLNDYQNASPVQWGYDANGSPVPIEEEEDTNE